MQSVLFVPPESFEPPPKVDSAVRNGTLRSANTPPHRETHPAVARAPRGQTSSPWGSGPAPPQNRVAGRFCATGRSGSRTAHQSSCRSAAESRTACRSAPAHQPWTRHAPDWHTGNAAPKPGQNRANPPADTHVSPARYWGARTAADCLVPVPDEVDRPSP
ncbi:hypothetical protein FQA39_LY19359 [Lamprigera yunnana]|nr:hypothetical protein FQA39_LY19359 [Lamprigera yunnana]